MKVMYFASSQVGVCLKTYQVEEGSFGNNRVLHGSVTPVSSLQVQSDVFGNWRP